MDACPRRVFSRRDYSIHRAASTARIERPKPNWRFFPYCLPLSWRFNTACPNSPAAITRPPPAMLGNLFWRRARRHDHGAHRQSPRYRTMGGECTSGTAETFDDARAEFEAAWLVFLSSRTEADFQAWRDQRDWTVSWLRLPTRSRRFKTVEFTSS